jgi:hypothetical protein
MYVHIFRTTEKRIFHGRDAAKEFYVIQTIFYNLLIKRFIFCRSVDYLLFVDLSIFSHVRSVRCIFIYVYFLHLLGGFLHILTCTCNYMLWPLAPREYNLSIPNMVSEHQFRVSVTTAATAASSPRLSC